MSKQREIDLLDGRYTKNINVPSTYKEFDEAIGEEGCALEDAVANVLYRNTCPRIYKGISTVLKDAHGFPRAQLKNEDGTLKFTTKKGGGQGSPVMELFTDHIRRFLDDVPPEVGAGLEGDERTAAIQEFLKSRYEIVGGIFDTVLSNLPFYVEGAGGFGGKVSKDAEDAATSLFNVGPDAVSGFVTVIEQTVPGYTVARDEGEVTIATLARGIQRLNKHLADQTKNQMKALLSSAKAAAPAA